MGKKNKNYNEEMEDITKYGEFISSYFAWIPLKKQKDRTESNACVCNSTV